MNPENLATHDARMVTELIANGEWYRALNHARLLVSSIEWAMSNQGITPTAVHIHETA